MLYHSLLQCRWRCELILDNPETFGLRITKRYSFVGGHVEVGRESTELEER